MSHALLGSEEMTTLLDRAYHGWFVPMSLGLIACAAVHIWSAVVLTRRALAARPVRYASKKPAKGESRHAVATMRWGAVVVFLFIIWHLLDLTFRTVNPVKDVPDAYGAVTATTRVAERPSARPPSVAAASYGWMTPMLSSTSSSDPSATR